MHKLYYRLPPGSKKVGIKSHGGVKKLDCGYMVVSMLVKQNVLICV